MFSSKKNQNTGYGDESSTTHGTSNTDTGRGPHKSSLLNKLDPRVDSTTGQSTGGTSRSDGGALGTTYGQENTGYGSSNTGYGSGTTGHNTGSTNAGPHSSNLANKMDPRVDSDQDRNTSRMSRDSGYNTQHNSGYSNPSTNTGYGSSTTTSGPHSSNLANKIDPRVDSDNSRSGYGNTSGTYNNPSGNYGDTSGTGYGNTGSTTTGPHSSGLANKMDPRVDSDRSKTTYGNTSGMYDNSPSTGAGYGSGQGQSTNAGPHKSNLLNKLDPRVDSDMDNSRTTGTYQGQGMNQGTNQGMNQGMSNTQPIPQEISSHGHATGPAGAVEGRHAKHTAGNVSNATASASVSGGMHPEGTANASGPTSADAGTTTSNQGGLMGAIKNMAPGHHNDHHQNQGEYASRNRNY